MHMKIKMMVCVLVGVCFLQGGSVWSEDKYQLKKLTPEVKASLDARRNRFEAIRGFKKQHILGENNRGYVQVLKKNVEAQKLADAENVDRKLIYQAIIQQNHLGDVLDSVEKVFAGVKRQKSESGDQIQNINGDWVTK